MERNANHGQGLDTVVQVKLVERGQSLERVYIHRDGSMSEAHKSSSEGKHSEIVTSPLDNPANQAWEQNHMGD